MPFDGSPKLPVTTAEKLQHLHDIISPIPAEDFNMNLYLFSCGTPACIAGHAAVDGVFQAMGLSVGASRQSVYTSVPLYDGATGTPALRMFFGITAQEAVWLFGDGLYGGKDERMHRLSTMILQYAAQEMLV